MSPAHAQPHIAYIGFKAAFHGTNLDIDLAPCVVEAYENDREQAQIFVQNATGTAFSQVEILHWFLLQTRTQITEHLPPQALQKRANPILLTVPIRFKPDMFHMETQAGAQDLSHLNLMCKVTLGAGEG